MQSKLVIEPKAKPAHMRSPEHADRRALSMYGKSPAEQGRITPEMWQKLKDTISGKTNR